MGPARCSWELRTGRLCTGLLGWPAVGSILVDRLELEDGEYLEECEPGLFALLCHGECSTVSLFTPPP